MESRLEHLRFTSRMNHHNRAGGDPLPGSLHRMHSPEQRHNRFRTRDVGHRGRSLHRFPEFILLLHRELQREAFVAHQFLHISAFREKLF